MALKNLGTVKAIHSGSTPPSNITMLWYNTGINAYTRYKHHYYDTNTSQWRELGLKDKISSNLLDNSITNIIVGSKSTHKTISFKFILIRNDQIATGSIEIINYNNTLQISESIGRTMYGTTDEVDEDAIVFLASYNSDEIRLEVSLSSTGNNAVIDLFNIDQI